MDDPALDAERHAQALRGLERINRWSGSSGILWGPIAQLARANPSRPLRVLDIAAGGGDVCIQMWGRAQRAQVPVLLEGCDVSAQAVQYAGERARQAGSQLRFFQLNALRDPLPTDYDVITNSLFLHHLTEDDAVGFLHRAAAATRQLFLVNDLRRSPGGLALAFAGTHVLSRSEIVHQDGIRSVRAAYTLDEVRQLVDRAGLPGAAVEKRWPFRYLLRYAKS